MIEIEKRGGTVVLRLAHGKANALDLELLEALTAQLADFTSSDIGAMVLTGSGSIFSAGVDLFRLVDGGGEYVARFLPALDQAFLALISLPFPVVAAVNGHAIAGGCLLVQACDVRIMAEGKGRIGVPELLVGVPFPALAVEMLRFAVAPQHLQEIVYSAKTLAAGDALAAGLVDEAVDGGDLIDRAMQRAAALAAIPRESFRMTKFMVRRPLLEFAKLKSRERDDELARVWESPETIRGIRDYLEKTVPRKK